jgi:hypothetical protein
MVHIKSLLKKMNIPVKGIELRQIKKGYKIELEHGKINKITNVTNDNPELTLKIAMAHLLENPDYYKYVKKGKEYLITI